MREAILMRWVGIPGLKIENYLEKFEQHLSTLKYKPTHVIVHVGSNNLNKGSALQISEKIILLLDQVELKAREAVTSNLLVDKFQKVIYSKILPRIRYTNHSIENGELLVKEINQQVEKDCLTKGRPVINYPDIVRSENDLYLNHFRKFHHDKVHLSRKGNERFLQNINRGICSILWD